MKKESRTRFNSAHVMAAIALFVALGGTAVALKKNSVGTRQLKNNAVKTNKIADGNVTNADLADGSVSTGKIADNAVTGAKADESTFGQVPSAANADNATNATNATTADNAGHADDADTVSGTVVDGVVFRTNDVTSSNVFVGGGLTITADCDAANDLDLNATTSVDNAVIETYSVDSGTGLVGNLVSDQDWDSADGAKIIGNLDLNEMLTVQYSRPPAAGTSASSVTASLVLDDGTPNADCLVTGHVLRSGGD